VFDWGKAPFPLRAYVVLTTGWTLVAAFVASVPVGLTIFTIVITLIWNFFLIQGVRWLWIVTIIFGALTISFDLIASTGTWYGISLWLVSLILLVFPATRRFFQADRPAAAA
jgi:hypothetical protein